MKSKKINKKKLVEERLEDLRIDVGLQILELRILKNITQGALAKKIGTMQPSIARAERGAITPSLDFLNKIAVALDCQLIPPKFSLVEQNEENYLNALTSQSWLTHHVEERLERIPVMTRSSEAKRADLQFA